MVLGARRCHGLHHRGLVRLQLISENYSRRLSIFRLFTQPGSKTEVLLLERHVRSTPKSRPRPARHVRFVPTTDSCAAAKSSARERPRPYVETYRPSGVGCG